MAVNSSVIAVTGANGFVGRAFCTRARMRGRELRRLVHQASEPEDAVALDLACASIDEMARRLEGVGTVVHLAGRAHVIKDVAADPESAYRDANEHATARIARAAVAAGARRFILASTVKVNGESTAPGRPFQPDDVVAPQDAYARSKLAAEAALAQAARGTSMGAITLRLPLVHGAGARGNFRRLVDAVRDGRWLPFGAIHNRRSLIGIDNLVDALDAAIDAPQRIEGVHFVADADGVSTPDLVRAIAHALGTEARLLPVPVPLLRLAGRAAGQADAIARLTSSLEVDTASFVAATAWRPRRFAIEAAEVTG
jgi:nucleoside-diphosphate-sugar epimerase